MIIAICDEELVGKTFHDGDLTLQITEEFYKGESVDDGAVVKTLSRATIANIAGERSVTCAMKNGFIDRENIIRICGIPHAQMVKMIR